MNKKILILLMAVSLFATGCDLFESKDDKTENIEIEGEETEKRKSEATSEYPIHKKLGKIDGYYFDDKGNECVCYLTPEIYTVEVEAGVHYYTTTLTKIVYDRLNSLLKKTIEEPEKVEKIFASKKGQNFDEVADIYYNMLLNLSSNDSSKYQEGLASIQSIEAVLYGHHLGDFTMPKEDENLLDRFEYESESGAVYKCKIRRDTHKLTMETSDEEYTYEFDEDTYYRVMRVLKYVESNKNIFISKCRSTGYDTSTAYIDPGEWMCDMLYSFTQNDKMITDEETHYDYAMNFLWDMEDVISGRYGTGEIVEGQGTSVRVYSYEANVGRGNYHDIEDILTAEEFVDYANFAELGKFLEFDVTTDRNYFIYTSGNNECSVKNLRAEVSGGTLYIYGNKTETYNDSNNYEETYVIIPVDKNVTSFKNRIDTKTEDQTSYQAPIQEPVQEPEPESFTYDDYDANDDNEDNGEQEILLND